MKFICRILLLISIYQPTKSQSSEFNKNWFLGYSLFDTPKKIKEQLKSDTSFLVISDTNIPRKGNSNDTIYLFYGKQLNTIVLNTYRVDSTLIGLTGGRSWGGEFEKYVGKTKWLEVEYFSRDRYLIENLQKIAIGECKKGTKKSSRHKFKVSQIGKKEGTVNEFVYANTTKGICNIWITFYFYYETLSYSLHIRELSTED